MRILIAGFGSIGRRHLSNLREIEPSATAILWRLTGRHRADSANCEAVFSADDAIAARPDAAIVACPAPFHLPVAKPLAEAGIPLLVEKPLADAVIAGEALVGLCASRGALLMVGYNFRFYRPLEVMRDAIAGGSIGRVISVRAEVGQYLPDWRQGDYRTTTTARWALGGGALLELSHELDYVPWLAGPVTQVNAHVATLGDLDVDVDDTAEILLRFKSGAVGSVHLDLLQRAYTRTCRVVGTDATVEWDWTRHEVVRFAKNRIDVVHASDPNAGMEMYQTELRHFLHAVRTRTQPGVTGLDGLRALDLVEAAKASSQDGRRREILCRAS